MAKKRRYDEETDNADVEQEYDPEPVWIDEPDDSPDADITEAAKNFFGPALASDALLKDRIDRPRATIGINDDGEVVEVPIDDEKQWYVIHCYSGYENKVRHAIEQRIETMGMQDKIFDVVVPTEEEIEVKEGKRRTVERRVFPGYILVQMKMDEDSWYVVRNTPGVTGFVGMGNEPTPLRPEEVNQIMRRMEATAPTVKVTYKPGQKVRIVDGPFNDFVGIVGDIDMDKSKVRVMVSFFGRETPVELDFLQVEKA
jgi:transcriptional antiterminator NusG